MILQITPETEDLLRKLSPNCLTKSQMLRELNIKVNSANITSLTKFLNFYKIDISHFRRVGWNRTDIFRPCRIKKYTIENILVENSPPIATTKLKKKLYDLGLLEEKCSKCGLGNVWNNEFITLQLDHINGNNLDNRIENLRILCPNCHSQTNTFNGKNVKKLSARTEKSEVEYLKFRETVAQLKYSGNPEPSVLLSLGLYDSTKPRKRKRKNEGAETLQGIPKVKKPKPLCELCGKECKERGRVYCSYECSKKAQASKVPSKEELINAFEIYKNFLQVGAFYHVSDNAVRKWCKKYGILNMVKRKSKGL